MASLASKVKKLKKTSLSARVGERVREFKKAGESGEDRIFSELCFCTLTANFNAQRAIDIQEAVGAGFITLSEKALAKRLRQLGYRFPNARASYIVDSRRHFGSLKETLKSFGCDFDARDWASKNVKGLGLKESSHFLRNIGYDSLAIIDFHIIDLLEAEGLIERPKTVGRKSYLAIEEVLSEICKKTGLCQAELDLYLWYMETGKILK